jgi:ketosteroid isomerase-like protein
MNRSALALLAGLFVLVLSGCQPAADTNRNLAAASPTPAKETFDPAAIESEVMRIEHEWYSAAKTHNAEAAKEFLADNVVLVYPDGTSATKADEIRSIESGAMTADTYEMLESKVTVMNADSAFITGRSVIKNGKIVVPNQKKPIDITGEYRFLDVYARRDGKWQVVASHAVKIDPAVIAAAAAASPATSVPSPPAKASPAAKSSSTP